MVFQRWRDRLNNALGATRQIFQKGLSRFTRGKVDVVEEDRLRQFLYEADMGRSVTEELLSLLHHHLRGEIALGALYGAMKRLLLAKLPGSFDSGQYDDQPTCFLLVGVNGTGKTTCAAKMSHFFQRRGKRPLLAGADTFRAAAQEQLSQWSQKCHIPLIRGQRKGDAAAVVYDALAAMHARDHDILVVDTAGRMQSRDDLMRELEKIHRVLEKKAAGMRKEVWFVLDATLGQHGVEQLRTFHQSLPLTGVCITKLDGSAFGGNAFALQEVASLPITFLGVGEGEDDLCPFDREAYVEGLFLGLKEAEQIR